MACGTLQCDTWLRDDICHWIRQVAAKLPCGRWLWDDMPLNSLKRPPYWNSKSGFDFDHITAVDMSFSVYPEFYLNRNSKIWRARSASLYSIYGSLGAKPQRGSGAEPLVIAQRASYLKLKAKPLDVKNRGKICPFTVRNCWETPTGNSSVDEIGKRNRLNHAIVV